MWAVDWWNSCVNFLTYHFIWYNKISFISTRAFVGLHIVRVTKCIHMYTYSLPAYSSCVFFLSRFLPIFLNFLNQAPRKMSFIRSLKASYAYTKAKLFSIEKVPTTYADSYKTQLIWFIEFWQGKQNKWEEKACSYFTVWRSLTIFLLGC